MRLVAGLAAVDAARIIAARRDSAFVSIDDVWRRSGVPHEALDQLAEADAFFPAFRLPRRDALWAIKPLREEPLPLFAAAATAKCRRSPNSKSRRSNFVR